MYGYNVYDLADPFDLRYPLYCKDYEEVEKVISDDQDRYVVRKRLSPEDDRLLDDE